MVYHFSYLLYVVALIINANCTLLRYVRNRLSHQVLNIVQVSAAMNNYSSHANTYPECVIFPNNYHILMHLYGNYMHKMCISLAWFVSSYLWSILRYSLS